MHEIADHGRLLMPARAQDADRQYRLVLAVAPPAQPNRFRVGAVIEHAPVVEIGHAPDLRVDVFLHRLVFQRRRTGRGQQLVYFAIDLRHGREVGADQRVRREPVAQLLYQ